MSSCVLRNCWTAIILLIGENNGGYPLYAVSLKWGGCSCCEESVSHGFLHELLRNRNMNTNMLWNCEYFFLNWLLFGWIHLLLQHLHWANALCRTWLSASTIYFFYPYCTCARPSEESLPSEGRNATFVRVDLHSHLLIFARGPAPLWGFSYIYIFSSPPGCQPDEPPSWKQTSREMRRKEKKYKESVWRSLKRAPWNQDFQDASENGRLFPSVRLRGSRLQNAMSVFSSSSFSVTRLAVNEGCCSNACTGVSFIGRMLAVKSKSRKKNLVAPCYLSVFQSCFHTLIHPDTLTGHLFSATSVLPHVPPFPLPPFNKVQSFPGKI